MTIYHVVTMKFKKDLAPETITRWFQNGLDLQSECIHPETKKPYIKSVVGGKDNSVEGMQNGYTHTFIMEFDSQEDRDYYAHEDPAHDEYKNGVKQVLEGAIVIDFTPGVFV